LKKQDSKSDRFITQFEDPIDQENPMLLQELQLKSDTSDIKLPEITGGRNRGKNILNTKISHRGGVSTHIDTSLLDNS
jgi:hypothetical protein